MEQKKQKAIISLLFTGVLMGALDISIVGPAIPSIESFLRLGPRFSGWIFSIYVLFNLIGAVFGLAFLMGPFIAGILLRYFEWHFLFIINLPVSLVMILLSFGLENRVISKPARN